MISDEHIRSPLTDAMLQSHKFISQCLLLLRAPHRLRRLRALVCKGNAKQIWVPSLIVIIGTQDVIECYSCSKNHLAFNHVQGARGTGVWFPGWGEHAHPNICAHGGRTNDTRGFYHILPHGRAPVCRLLMVALITNFVWVVYGRWGLWRLATSIFTSALARKTLCFFVRNANSCCRRYAKMTA